MWVVWMERETRFKGKEKVAQKMKNGMECWVFVSVSLLRETGLEGDKCGAELV